MGEGQNKRMHKNNDEAKMNRKEKKKHKKRCKGVNEDE